MPKPKTWLWGGRDLCEGRGTGAVAPVRTNTHQQAPHADGKKRPKSAVRMTRHVRAAIPRSWRVGEWPSAISNLARTGLRSPYLMAGLHLGRDDAFDHRDPLRADDSFICCIHTLVITSAKGIATSSGYRPSPARSTQGPPLQRDSAKGLC